MSVRHAHFVQSKEAQERQIGNDRDWIGWFLLP